MPQSQFSETQIAGMSQDAVSGVAVAAENAKLKRMYADLALEHTPMTDVLQFPSDWHCGVVIPLLDNTNNWIAGTDLRPTIRLDAR